MTMTQSHIIPAEIYDRIKARAEELGGVGSGQVYVGLPSVPLCIIGFVSVLEGIELDLENSVNDQGETVYYEIDAFARQLGYDSEVAPSFAMWQENDKVIWEWRREGLNAETRRMPFDLWAERMGWVRAEG
jgi:hypothetical protein